MGLCCVAVILSCVVAVLWGCLCCRCIVFVFHYILVGLCCYHYVGFRLCCCDVALCSSACGRLRPVQTSASVSMLLLRGSRVVTYGGEKTFWNLDFKSLGFSNFSCCYNCVKTSCVSLKIVLLAWL